MMMSAWLRKRRKGRMKGDMGKEREDERKVLGRYGCREEERYGARGGVREI